MDRSLDEILAERQTANRRGRGGRNNDRGSNRGRDDRRRGERTEYPRDGVRKSFRDRDDTRNLDSEWVHDKFEDSGARPSNGPQRRSPAYDGSSRGAKIRVDNIHYELTEDDLDVRSPSPALRVRDKRSHYDQGLFKRIGPIQDLKLLYDRAGRSEGVAFVTYESYQDAKDAIREFDGANAAGQPIRLTLMPSGPAPRARNPFDNAVVPGRSLAERITVPNNRSRSLSPGRSYDEGSSRRRDDVDSYRPSGSRSPRPSRGPRRDGGGGGGGRRPGGRGEGRGRGPRGGGGGGERGGERTARDGRPRKTQEELDAEMDNYFNAQQANGGGEQAAANDQDAGNGNRNAGNIEDIDMIE
ncbi:hypothetical protein GE09DRAFT_1285340 [Coniochaeta sp. 2T2.1]|nr:hypothetical protein GE09DRAFT_1285340 [Coniochaeta sp. 2T2.1]